MHGGELIGGDPVLDVRAVRLARMAAGQEGRCGAGMVAAAVAERGGVVL